MQTDNEKIEAFYKSLGNLCSEHKISGFVGIWFDGPSDNYGLVVNYDITNADMKTICTRIGAMLQGWADHVAGTHVWDNNVSNVTGPPGEEN